MVNDLPQRKTHNVKGSTTRFVEGGITLTAQDGEVYHSGSCMIALVWDDTGDQVIRAHIRRLFDEDDILLTRDDILWVDLPQVVRDSIASGSRCVSQAPQGIHEEVFRSWGSRVLADQDGRPMGERDPYAGA